MVKKLEFQVRDIDESRFHRDTVEVELENGTTIKGKLLAIHPGAWDLDYGLAIDGVPLLRVPPYLSVTVIEAERPGDNGKIPIILNMDNYKDEFLGKWVRWYDQPASEVGILKSRSVETYKAGDGRFMETVKYTFVNGAMKPRTFIRNRKENS